MSRAFFLTGTDTLVGKTTVGAGLLALARQRKIPCLGWKPVASGCPRENGELISEDAALLARGATGSTQCVTPAPLYLYEEELAPGVAAERNNRPISLEQIADTGRALLETGAANRTFTIIEGAGGWLVPLYKGKTFADLAQAIGLPLVIVARAGLGTINHTLLTIEAIRARGLVVAGVILNDIVGDTPPPFARSNADEIARYSNAPVLGCLPHLPDPTPDNTAELLANRLELAPLGLRH